MTTLHMNIQIWKRNFSKEENTKMLVNKISILGPYTILYELEKFLKREQREGEDSESGSVSRFSQIMREYRDSPFGPNVFLLDIVGLRRDNPNLYWNLIYRFTIDKKDYMFLLPYEVDIFPEKNNPKEYKLQVSNRINETHENTEIEGTQLTDYNKVTILSSDYINDIVEVTQIQRAQEESKEDTKQHDLAEGYQEIEVIEEQDIDQPQIVEAVKEPTNEEIKQDEITDKPNDKELNTIEQDHAQEDLDQVIEKENKDEKNISQPNAVMKTVVATTIITDVVEDIKTEEQDLSEDKEVNIEKKLESISEQKEENEEIKIEEPVNTKPIETPPFVPKKDQESSDEGEVEEREEFNPCELIFPSFKKR